MVMNKQDLHLAKSPQAALPGFIARRIALTLRGVKVRERKAEDLPPAVLAGAERQPRTGFHEWKEKMLQRLEREFVEETLGRHGGNVTRAAQALGIHRSTLQRLMRRLKLPVA